MGGNAYLNKAVPSSHEPNALASEKKGITVEVDLTENKVHVEVTDSQLIRQTSQTLVTTGLMGKAYHADMKFEHPDSSPYELDSDFFGSKRPNSSITPGPFELTEDSPITFTI